MERKADVSTTTPERYTALRTIAEELSLRNLDRAVVELLNEALARTTMLVYEKDEDGFINIDRVTGKILIPLPWGKKGHKRWNLRPSEANALRAIMFSRQRNGLPLFFFDRSRRAWYISLADHAAMPVLSEWEITVAEYRLARAV
jgi:hypothetical protein